MLKKFLNRWHLRHQWRPMRVFYSQFVDQNGNPLYYKTDFIGHSCLTCKLRKLETVRKNGSPGARQQAYDWLNADAEIWHLERCLKQ